MKQLKLTMLLTIIWSIIGIETYAYDFAVENDDGVTIYYNYINEGKELEVSLISPNSYSGNFVIPSKVTYMGRTRGVTSIGQSAFHSCSGLTSITIPNSITSVGGSAFYHCSGLNSVIIEDGENVLAFSTSYDPHSDSSYTFSGCPVEKLYLGRNVSYESYYSPFKGNEKLKTLTIGNSVTSIGYSAFSGCSGLTSISIPNSVTSIGYSAFSGCSGLTSISIPNSVTSIGFSAFSGCI